MKFNPQNPDEHDKYVAAGHVARVKNIKDIYLAHGKVGILGCDA